MSGVNRILFVIAGLGGAVLLPPDSDLDLAQSPHTHEKASPTPMAKPATPEAVVVTVLPGRLARPVTLNIPPAIPTSALWLQRELARAGCYAGELDGIWGAGSQRAMKAFTNRVNAELPTDKPEPALLALVQAHQERVCGVPCPRGQTVAADGQCIPDALIALGGGPKVRASPTDKIVWIAKPTAGVERRQQGDKGILRAIADAGSTRTPSRHRAAAKREHWRSSQQGKWAQSFFKQQDRLGLH